MAKANYKGVADNFLKDNVKKKKPAFRYSESEINLIKATFSDNDELLMALKKSMLQLELTEAEEVAILNTFNGKTELMTVLRKFFTPTLEDKNIDVHQMTDMWSIIEREINFRDRKVEDAWPLLQVADKTIKYINHQLDILEGKIFDVTINFKEMVNLDYNNPTDSYTSILTRNLIFTRVEKVIMAIYGMSLNKNETPEELAERLALNSNK
jgi:hypothetical protein